MFSNVNVSLSTNRAESECHQSLWHVRVSSAGTTYFSENHFKAMFLLQLISILLITFSVIFYTYLANINFFMQLGLGQIQNKWIYAAAS